MKKYLFIIVTFLPLLSVAQFVENPQTNEGLGTDEAVDRIDNIINVFLAVVVIASFFGFLFSIVQYLVSGGSEGSLSKARSTAIASLIGLSLSLLAYVIIKLLQFLI